MIRLYIYAAVASAVIAAVTLGYIHKKGQWLDEGRAEVRAEWDKERQAAADQAETLRLARQGTVNKTAEQFAAKVTRDRIVVQTIIKEVDRYVPNTLPMLPADFRLYYDAAVTGKAIDDTGRADAAPVSPRQVAENAASNYAACRYDQERLEALQQVVRVLNPG